jgi:hypothetical protein
MREEEALAIFFGMIGFVGFVWVIARYSYLTFKQWQATTLIRDMINRGYTAQEIIQICQVLGQKKLRLSALCDVPPAKPIRQPAYTP